MDPGHWITQKQAREIMLSAAIEKFYIVFVDDEKDGATLVTEAVSAVLGQWFVADNAPRDGSHFLACHHTPGFSFYERPPTVVHWFNDGFYTSVNELEPQRPFEFTHWQPLPPEPKP